MEPAKRSTKAKGKNDKPVTCLISLLPTVAKYDDNHEIEGVDEQKKRNGVKLESNELECCEKKNFAQCFVKVVIC